MPKIQINDSLITWKGEFLLGGKKISMCFNSLSCLSVTYSVFYRHDELSASI